MAGEITTRKQQELGSLGFAGLPTIISAAGERASFRFIEFFTANIRNPNNRVSYGGPAGFRAPNAHQPQAR